MRPPLLAPPRRAPPATRALAALLALACASDAPAPGDTDGDSDAPVDTAPPGDPAWVCAPDDAVCDGVCTAVRSDPSACGDCDTVCGDGRVCDEGTCIDRPVAPTCDEAVRASLLAAATVEAPTVELACSVTLEPGDVVTKRVLLLGAEASGVTLDCRGATIRRSLPGGGPDTVVVGARKVGEAAWERPTDVTVRGCVIEGSVRVQGQGVNGQDPDVTTDSHEDGHRERAQRAAPTRVLLDELTVVGDGRIPVYLAPGATRVTLRNSTLRGTTVSTIVYADAESAHVHLVGNTFDAEATGDPLPREVVALDGSADAVLASNTLRGAVGGGVFVYRNCGEGGAVRHQEPRRNVITGNLVVHDVAPFAAPIWVGSRNVASVFRSYCPLDDAWPFGSGANDDDVARNTVVAGNRFAGEAPDPLVRVDDAPTVELDNVTTTDEASGPPSCVVFRDGAPPRLVAEGATWRGRTCREGRLQGAGG